MKKNYLYTDLQNHKFIPVFQEIIDLYLRYKVINPNDAIVYQVLMRYLCRDKANRHYGYTYITNKGISSCCGVSAPTVAKALTKLNEVGLVEIHENPFKQGDFQKYRYTVYEPLNQDEFFENFGLEKKFNTELEEKKFTQGNERLETGVEQKVEHAKQQAEKKVEIVEPINEPVVEDILEDEVEQEVQDEVAVSEEPKPKKPRKKAKEFHEKEVEDWNYKNFIEFFCYKFREAYGSEYRVSNWAKEQKRLSDACEKYFSGNKIAFMFYMEELFAKRKRFENQQFPTLSIGTVCSFTNSFDIPRLMKKAKLTANKNEESAVFSSDVKIIDNKDENMLKYNKEEEITKNIDFLNEEKKQSFNELKSLFNL